MHFMHATRINGLQDLGPGGSCFRVRQEMANPVFPRRIRPTPERQHTASFATGREAAQCPYAASTTGTLCVFF